MKIRIGLKLHEIQEPRVYPLLEKPDGKVHPSLDGTAGYTRR